MAAKFIPVHHPVIKANSSIPEQALPQYAEKGWKKGHKPEFDKKAAS